MAEETNTIHSEFELSGADMDARLLDKNGCADGFLNHFLVLKSRKDIRDWKDKTGQDIRLSMIIGRLVYEPVDKRSSHL